MDDDLTGAENLVLLGLLAGLVFVPVTAWLRGRRWEAAIG